MPHLPGQLDGCECTPCRLYRTSDKHRAYWDSQRLKALAVAKGDATSGLGEPTIKTPRTDPCRHLGPPTGDKTSCKSCKGRVELKLFACSEHGTCTMTKHAADHACCKTCPDYLPLPPLRKESASASVR